MAVGIENLVNIDTTDPTAYPNGNLKDNNGTGNGTPLNVTSMADVWAFFDKMLRVAGITANGDPDNETNGHQYYSALGTWQDAGALTITALTGSITVSGGGLVYNKYCILGNTLHWQIQIRTATISGGPTGIKIALPTALTAFTFGNDGSRQAGLYNVITPMAIVLGSPANNEIFLTLGGTPFTNGTNDQEFDISIVAELA